MTAVLDYRVPLVVDGEPRQIARIRPLLNAIVPRAIEVEARVLDVHSPLAQVALRLGSGAWNAMGGAGFAGQFASRELATSNGPLTLQVRARDNFGNEAVSDPWSVVVDSLPPVMVVSGVTNNNRPVTDRHESGAVQTLQRRRPHVLQCGLAAGLTRIRQKQHSGWSYGVLAGDGHQGRVTQQQQHGRAESQKFSICHRHRQLDRPELVAQQFVDEVSESAQGVLTAGWIPHTLRRADATATRKGKKGGWLFVMQTAESARMARGTAIVLIARARPTCFVFRDGIEDDIYDCNSR